MFERFHQGNYSFIFYDGFMKWSFFIVPIKNNHETFNFFIVSFNWFHVSVNFAWFSNLSDKNKLIIPDV